MARAPHLVQIWRGEFLGPCSSSFGLVTSDLECFCSLHKCIRPIGQTGPLTFYCLPQSDVLLTWSPLDLWWKFWCYELTMSFSTYSCAARMFCRCSKARASLQVLMSGALSPKQEQSCRFRLGWCTYLDLRCTKQVAILYMAWLRMFFTGLGGPYDSLARMLHSNCAHKALRLRWGPLAQKTNMPDTYSGWLLA